MELNKGYGKLNMREWLRLQIGLLLVLTIGMTGCTRSSASLHSELETSGNVALSIPGRLVIYGASFAELHLRDASCIALALPQEFYSNVGIDNAFAEVSGSTFTQPTGEETAYAYFVNGVWMPLNLCRPDATLVTKVKLEDGRLFDYGRWWKKE